MWVPLGAEVFSCFSVFVWRVRLCPIPFNVINDPPPLLRRLVNANFMVITMPWNAVWNPVPQINSYHKNRQLMCVSLLHPSRPPEMSCCEVVFWIARSATLSRYGAVQSVLLEPSSICWAHPKEGSYLRLMFVFNILITLYAMNLRPSSAWQPSEVAKLCLWPFYV